MRPSLRVGSRFLALLLAVVGGAGLAILFNQSRMLELSFYPYAVILQVTPVVSIAPLIFIYVDSKVAGIAAVCLAGGLLPGASARPRWA